MTIELIWDFRIAIVNGKRVQLDLNESRVLRELLNNAPELSRIGTTARRLFGSSSKKNAIGVYVMRLRRKLGRKAILTVSGKGYRCAA